VSYSRHAYNTSGNPYFTGITVPWPGYPGNAVPRDPLTSADLDAYFNNSLNGATWFALPSDVRDQAVVEAQRWLMTLCWLPAADCCGRDFEQAVLMATAELALALAQEPTAVIGGAEDGRWTKREKLDVLEVEYDLLRSSPSAPSSGYPLIVQRFPWLKDILGCWLQIGPQRQIRLLRN
jgi:hypothetical protein